MPLPRAQRPLCTIKNILTRQYKMSQFPSCLYVNCFVCLVASTFPVIHIVKMYGYHHCEDKNNDCLCYGSPDPLSRQFTYKQLGNCDILYCLVKIFFIVQSGLCALGSGISFWYNGDIHTSSLYV
jgi:hypothetical protein